MEIYYISVLLREEGKEAIELCNAKNLVKYGYFQRSTVAEFLLVFSKKIAELTLPNQRQEVEKNDYMMHVYVRPDGLTGIIVSDKEYPMRVAHTLITKVLDEFSMQYPKQKLTQADQSTRLPFPLLDEYIQKYQDPKQADTIMRVQQDLDETKQYLHKSIEELLKRGEKLEDLVSRSNDLSVQSKIFYKAAKKQNSCCLVM